MDVEKGSKQEQAIMLDDLKQYDYSEWEASWKNHLLEGRYSRG